MLCGYLNSNYTEFSYGLENGTISLLSGPGHLKQKLK